jgi:hypothetical protein
MLHPVSCHSCMRLWSTDAIGASSDPKNPPICKIAFFCLRENDFFISALNPALFLLSFSFCSLANGPLPLLHPVSCHSCMRLWLNNMVSQRLKMHGSDMLYLQKTKPWIRKHIITKADSSLVDDTFGVLAPWSAIRLSGFGIEPCNGHWDLWFYGETDSERCTWRWCFCGDSFSPFFLGFQTNTIPMMSCHGYIRLPVWLPDLQAVDNRCLSDGSFTISNTWWLPRQIGS